MDYISERIVDEKYKRSTTKKVTHKMLPKTRLTPQREQKEKLLKNNSNQPPKKTPRGVFEFLEALCKI
jgi:hypothetical protein